MILPQAQAVVGHLLSDAGATCVGGDEGLPARSGLGSVGARDDVSVSQRCLRMCLMKN